VILALDPGQRTGWAISDRRCGTLDFTRMTWGEISSEWRPWLSRMLREHAIEAVAYEMAFARSNHSALPLGLIWDVCAVARNHNVVVMECRTQDAKRAIGVTAVRGQPRAAKRAVFGVVQGLGWPVRYQHEADAVAVLAWAEDRLSRVAPRASGLVIAPPPGGVHPIAERLN
jgi:Holliday junction resolvasome RuvABC endonuclease subunit